MNSTLEFKDWFAKNASQIKEDYFRFLRFPSVSADKAYKADVLQCASFLSSYLKEGGLLAEEIPTPGYPIVYAEEMTAGPKAPTVLIYGHYDVQPVDPLELWESPPFEPTEREGKVFARGAVDDKGQIFYACLALIAWKKLRGKLPVNLKFCIEGEEESHSMGLVKSLPSLKEKFKADYLLIVDFDSMPDKTPAVSLGARGCIGLEFSIGGSHHDLHSGQMGGIAYNPLRAISELLSKLWDKNGTVAVPGFYEGVKEPSREDLHAFTFSYTEALLEKDFGLKAFGNEKGRSLKESNWFRPTLELNGIFGGYAGEGTKTVIPKEAHAKITCRLVKGQDPDKVSKAIGDFLEANAERGMKVKVIHHGGIGAFRSDADSPMANAVVKAASEVTGKKCSRVLSGASIPIAADLARVLNIQPVGMGFGLPTDNIHAPNEHFDMDRFEKGFLTVAKVIECL